MRTSVLTAVLALGLAGGAHAAGYADLSPAAKKIVDAVKATGEANTACKSRDTLRPAVEAAVKSLMASGDLSGTPRAEAREAGGYMLESCGSL